MAHSGRCSGGHSQHEYGSGVAEVAASFRRDARLAGWLPDHQNAAPRDLLRDPLPERGESGKFDGVSDALVNRLSVRLVPSCQCRAPMLS